MKTMQIIAVTMLCTSILWVCLISAYGTTEEETTEQVSVVETTTEATTEETTVTETTTEEPKTISLGTFYITGYTPDCSHCCGKTDAIGSSGRKIVSGKSVAMNRADMRRLGLEYGDKIYIN